MGKLITYISILIFVDLLFIATGQQSPNSPVSIILQSFLDPSNIMTSKFFLIFFGTLGIGGLAVSAGVSTGLVNKTGIDILGFAALAVALTGLIPEFVLIYLLLNAQNPVLALFIMAPIIILLLVTIGEWLKNKD